MYNKIFTLILCAGFHLLEASDLSKIKPTTVTFSDISLGLKSMERVLKKVDISNVDNTLNRQMLEHLRITKLPTYQGMNDWFNRWSWAIPKDVYKNNLLNIEIYLNAYSNLFTSIDITKMDSSDQIQLYLQKIDDLDQQLILMLKPLISFFNENPIIVNTGIDLGAKKFLDYTTSMLRKVEP
jgi:hypothetical protein